VTALLSDFADGAIDRAIEAAMAEFFPDEPATGLAVIALYAFTNSWNEFLFALLLIGRDSEKTIPSGLAGLINGDVFQWGELMAGAIIASLPPVLIYLAAQKWVISGLAGGAVKG